MGLSMDTLNAVPVVILCGGRQVVIESERPSINKALVEIEGIPLFWWVLMHYVLSGAVQFILAIGTQAQTFHKAIAEIGAQPINETPDVYSIKLLGRDCRIRLVETGDDSTTASRLIQCRPYLMDSPVFAVTYSDTLTDIPLGSIYDFHKKHGLVATLLGAQLPIRFRILGVRYNEIKVRGFSPRPVLEATPINGGYYFFNNLIWDKKFSISEDVPLENNVLESLASSGELAVYSHVGKWQNFDAVRDLPALLEIVVQIKNRLLGK